MFCEMEGFTQLTERLGPEEAHNIMDQGYEILIHKVHDYEGTVNEMTGSIFTMTTDRISRELSVLITNNYKTIFHYMKLPGT